MKIIFCADAFPQTTGHYYERALRSMGHEVTTIGPIFDKEDCESCQNVEEMNNRWRGTGRFTRWAALKRLPQHRDHTTRPGETRIPVASLLRCEDYDALIWVDAGLHRLTLDLTNVKIPCVALLNDIRVSIEAQIQHASQFTQAYLLATPEHVQAFRSAGINTAWIPPAADVDLHLVRNRVEPIWDVGFVGSTSKPWHPRRVSILEEIEKNFDLKVESALHQEMALFNKRCRVLFNCSLDGDINMRVAESMISGRPLVTDMVEGLESMCPDGSVVAYYKDEEVIPIIGKLLSDEKRCADIGHAGQELVLARHTYRDRIGIILDRLS